MATSKVKMKVEEPFNLINKVIEKYQLNVPEYILRLEFFEDEDGKSLTAFFSDEKVVESDAISSSVTLGLSSSGKPVFLEIFI